MARSPLNTLCNIRTAFLKRKGESVTDSGILSALVRQILSVIGLAIVAMVGGAVYALEFCRSDWCSTFALQRVSTVHSFAECASEGLPILETTPRTCRAGLTYYPETSSPITVDVPLRDGEVGLPFIMKGKAGSGITAIRYTLTDADGFILRDGSIDMERTVTGATLPFGAFENFPAPFGTGGNLRIEALRGAESVQLENIPIRFPVVMAQDVKVYFRNSERDPEGSACEITYPVERRVAANYDGLSASLTELMHGPTASEQAIGAFTAIDSRTIIRSVDRENGTIIIDFSVHLIDGIRDSCRLEAIRSQIRRTLSQFPWVTRIILTVEGKQFATYKL